MIGGASEFRTGRKRRQKKRKKWNNEQPRPFIRAQNVGKFKTAIFLEAINLALIQLDKVGPCFLLRLNLSHHLSGSRFSFSGGGRSA